MRRFFLVLLGLIFVAAPVVAAPRVVSSIMPVNALVGAVMDGVAVPQTLLPPGASPHSYALRPSDVRMLAEADLVFWIGPGLEQFMDRPLKTLAASAQSIALVRAPGLRLLKIRPTDAFSAETEDQPTEREDHGDNGHDHIAGSQDPHIWLDPGNAIALVHAIARTLIKADPGNA